MCKSKKKYKAIRINIPFEEYIIINEIVANKGYKDVSEWIKTLVKKEIRNLKSELQPSGWVKLDVDPLNFIDKLSEEFISQCMATYNVSSLPFEIIAKDYSEQERIVYNICKLLENSVSRALKSFSADKLLSAYRCYAEPHKLPFASLIFYIDEYPYSVFVDGNLIFDEQLRARFTVKGLRISGDLVLTFWHKKLFEILVDNLNGWNPKVEKGNVEIILTTEDAKPLEQGLIKILKEFGSILNSDVVNVDCYIGVNSVRAEGEYARNSVYYTIVIDGVREEIRPGTCKILLRLTS